MYDLVEKVTENTSVTSRTHGTQHSFITDTKFYTVTDAEMCCQGAGVHGRFWRKKVIAELW
jgi:hypothetical protein